MKQTAIDWLTEQMCGKHTRAWKLKIKQAKQMEQLQMLEMWVGGITNAQNNGKSFDKYYQDKYENKLNNNIDID